jgi:hypothetical protein
MYNIDDLVCFSYAELKNDLKITLLSPILNERNEIWSYLKM